MKEYIKDTITFRDKNLFLLGLVSSAYVNIGGAFYGAMKAFDFAKTDDLTNHPGYLLAGAAAGWILTLSAWLGAFRAADETLYRLDKKQANRKSHFS